MANIGNSDQATHSAIIIIKNVDKSSPLHARALASREKINCDVEFYRVSSYALQENFTPSILVAGLYLT